MREFGRTSDGRVVHSIGLDSDALSVQLITYGAILQDVRLRGVPHGLTLGSDTVADYEGPLASFGPVIGPVVNRLTDAKAPLGDQVLSFPPNADGGHFLHSGPDGTMTRVWDVVEEDTTSCLLGCDLPDGACGLPGNRRIEAAFSVDGSTLKMDLGATTDALTLMNLANHSYWTLQDSPTWDGHSLRVAADHVLPTTETFVPTGEIRAVEGTDLDLREALEISPGAPAFDNNFCLSDADTPLRDVLWLTGKTGVRMTMATTAPGVQVYDQRAQARPGKQPYEGLAFEAQGWPDAPNHTGFPTMELGAGETWRQTTTWRFEKI